MNYSKRFSLRLCMIALAAAFAAAPTFAEKPDWAGGGKEGKHGNKHEEYGPGERGDRRDRPERPDREDRRGGRESRAAVDIRFVDTDRRVVYDYFGAQFRSGSCPPGLAKKGNGCLPPGQAKKWAMGRPLPRDVMHYPLPHDLLIRLPLPPAGHEYVRVATDILLIAVGTGIVLDAIEDIGR